MNIILLGAPGAGKGTQAEVICKALNIPTISTGNMLRAAVKAGTEYGLKAKAAMDAGDLVSDDIVIGILKDRIAEPDAQNGFILDGFPRTVAQADALYDMGISIDKVISIEVDDDDIIKRLSGRRECSGCRSTYHIDSKPSAKGDNCEKCGAPLTIRPDDEPETIKKRLDVYHEQTEALKDYYEGKKILHKVCGSNGIEATTKSIVAVLEN